MQIDKLSGIKVVIAAVLIFFIAPFLLASGNKQQQIPTPTIATNSTYEQSLADDAKLYIKDKMSTYIISKPYLQQSQYTVTDFSNLGGGFGFTLVPKNPGKSVSVYVAPSGFNDIKLYADGESLN